MLKGSVLSLEVFSLPFIRALVRILIGKYSLRNASFMRRVIRGRL
jgi:hypothetical protein